MAIEFIAYAAEAGDSEVDKVVQSVERILPDLPGACFLEQVGGEKAFEEAVQRVKSSTATLPSDSTRHRALVGLLDYICDS